MRTLRAEFKQVPSVPGTEELTTFRDRDRLGGCVQSGMMTWVEMRVAAVALVLVILLTSPACCSAVPHEASNDHRLVRRQAKTTYYVDVLVLVDYASYLQWLEWSQASGGLTKEQVADRDMKRYFTLVINETSDQYSRLQTSFGLKIAPVGFYIQTQRSQLLPWSRLETRGQLVDSKLVLDDLQQWLSQSMSTQVYDHAVLFTGTDLSSDNSGHTTGRATVGTLCKGDRSRSVSVIEDKGAFQSVRTFVHELGHSLNAIHDGTSGNLCNQADNFIMASGITSAAGSRNPWFFSSCSAHEIQDYIDRLLSEQSSRQCLQNSVTPSSDLSITQVMPGQWYDANTQCKHLYGSGASFCVNGNQSSICTRMPCRSTANDTLCYERFAATGTSCGNKMWCQVGACKYSEDAPEVGDCPYGDYATVKGVPCTKVISGQPQLCYDPKIREGCCKSCQNIYTGRPGCPYGDRKVGCRKDVCQLIEPNGYKYVDDCCGTCNFDSTTWTCTDVSKVDGMSCAKALSQHGIQWCYNTTLAYLCCSTCSQQRNLSRPHGCEYGNVLLLGCSGMKAGSAGCDVKSCCETCSTDDAVAAASSLHGQLPVAVFVLVSLLSVYNSNGPLL